MRLAQAYGYCWGVERAVQMAYEARKQYPGAKLHVTNEIIHNPAVNQVRPLIGPVRNLQLHQAVPRRQAARHIRDHPQPGRQPGPPLLAPRREFELRCRSTAATLPPRLISAQ